MVISWIVNPANNHSYGLVDRTNWVEAEVQARLSGGHLATINDAAEQDWVYQTFGNYGGTNRRLWIGLNDAGKEGHFVWANGEPLDYTHWDAGEPNNWGGNEDYVAMFQPGHRAPSRWNDWGGSRGFNDGFFGGVAEIDDIPQYASFSLGTDSTWRAVSPEGNLEGQPIGSVGQGFISANPGWNTAFDYNPLGWGWAQELGDGVVWGSNSDTPLFLRKTFTLTTAVEDILMYCSVDADALVYINGTSVISDTDGSISGFGPVDVTDHLVMGENLIAVMAHDSNGASEGLSLHIIGTAIPEPSTLLLLCIGVVGLLAYAWRRRRR